MWTVSIWLQTGSTVEFMRTLHEEVRSSELQCRVYRLKSTDVSEEGIAPIFTVEEKAKREPSIKQAVSFLVYSSTLKMEAEFYR
jgi:hypothetical protein